MEQMRLVEPDRFARTRVNGIRLTQLARAQHTVGRPLTINATLATKRLHPILFGRATNVLPSQIETFGIVANVQQPIAREPGADARINPAIDRPTVSNRSLSTSVRQRLAIEPDLHWPDCRVGLLVMLRNPLVS